MVAGSDGFDRDISRAIGALQAEVESAKSQRANTYARIERVEQQLARQTAILESLPTKLDSLGAKMDVHAERDEASFAKVSQRLETLEHDFTSRKTERRIIWGAISLLGIGNVWAIFKGAILAALKAAG